MKTEPLEFKLNENEKYPVQLTFMHLIKLKSKNKSIVEKYDNIIMRGAKNLSDCLFVIYVAYLCVNKEQEEKTFDYFLENASYDVKYINELTARLIQPKKK